MLVCSMTTDQALVFGFFYFIFLKRPPKHKTLSRERTRLPNLLVGEIPGDREMVRNPTSSGCSDRHACVDFSLLSPRSLRVSIARLCFSNTSFGALGSVFQPVAWRSSVVNDLS